MEKEDRLKVPLREQEHLKELFCLLEKNGMEQEKKQVLQMADYIEGMEEKMGEVLEELQKMREQLSGIENKGARVQAEKVVESVAEKIGEAREALGNLKKAFLQRVEQAVLAGRTRGREALSGILKTIHLPGAASRVQQLLNRSIKAADQGIEKLGDMADELHAAKQHLGNAGRALTGEKIKRLYSRDPERGLIHETQRLLYQSMISMEQMEHRTGKLLEQMEHLTSQEEEKKPSVRDTIQKLKEENKSVQEPSMQQRKEPVRE